MYNAIRGLDAGIPATVPTISQDYDQSALPLYMAAATRRAFDDKDDKDEDKTTKSTSNGTTGSDGDNPADNESFDWIDDDD